MIDPRVWVFFYGSYMNRRVLSEAGLAPGRLETARLSGFDVALSPLANLVPSDRHSVYGLLTTATHPELERLYQHARNVLGGVYHPFPVIADRLDGSFQPALCYIAPEMRPGPPDPDYVDRIVAPAREHGFPAWYVERLESFRGAAPGAVTGQP